MKTWKQVGNAWRGYGNGFKAVIYSNALDETVQVRIYNGDTLITTETRPNILSAKTWAERHYLKGTHKNRRQTSHGR